MGPLCNSLCYNENGKTMFIFYDGRGSDVYGIDFAGQELYSNEYGPMGEILYSIDYSKISFACSLYDEDIGSYIDKSSGSIGPFKNLSYSVYATPLIKMLKGFGGNNHSISKSVSWNWIMWMCGDSRTNEDFIDCALEVICGLDFDCMDGGDGDDEGGGEPPKDECKEPTKNTKCTKVCKDEESCIECCKKVEELCIKDCKGKEQCILGCQNHETTCEKACAQL